MAFPSAGSMFELPLAEDDIMVFPFWIGILRLGIYIVKYFFRDIFYCTIVIIVRKFKKARTNKIWQQGKFCI
jgi:hypothetical protein